MLPSFAVIDLLNFRIFACSRATRRAQAGARSSGASPDRLPTSLEMTRVPLPFWQIQSKIPSVPPWLG